MARLKVRWGFDFCFTEDCIGRRGGLELLWSRDVDLTVLSYSGNHIDARIRGGGNGIEWRFTRFYGHLGTNRSETWRLLRELNNRPTLPWLCMGDFNELLDADEKRGEGSTGVANRSI